MFSFALRKAGVTVQIRDPARPSDPPLVDLVSSAGMTTADRLAPFGVTIFSEMTALAVEHDAINLGQGFPNWAGAGFVKEAAAQSMVGGNDDQYPPSAGIPGLRQAIADRYGPLLGRDLDPGAEITVTSGCTEALAASFLGLVNPGDEVVLIEPYYDAYPVNAAIAGAVPKYVRTASHNGTSVPPACR